MTSELERFTLMAREEPEMRFTALMGLLFDPEGLRESFERQDGRKAPGVDGVRKEDYAEDLEARLEDLTAFAPTGLPAEAGAADLHPERGRRSYRDFWCTAQSERRGVSC